MKLWGNLAESYPDPCTRLRWTLTQTQDAVCGMPLGVLEAITSHAPRRCKRSTTKARQRARLRRRLAWHPAVGSPGSAVTEDTMSENGHEHDDPIGHLDAGDGTTFADWVRVCGHSGFDAWDIPVMELISTTQASPDPARGPAGLGPPTLWQPTANSSSSPIGRLTQPPTTGFGQLTAIGPVLAAR